MYVNPPTLPLREDNVTEERSEDIFKRLNHQVKHSFWQFSSHLPQKHTALPVRQWGLWSQSQSAVSGTRVTWCQVPNSPLYHSAPKCSHCKPRHAEPLPHFFQRSNMPGSILTWLARDSINAQSSCHCSSLKEKCKPKLWEYQDSQSFQRV